MNTDPTLPASPAPRNRWQSWFAGMLIGDIAIGLLYGLGALIEAKMHLFGQVLAVPSFFLVPMLGGLVASYIWRSLKPTIGATVLNSLWMTLLGLAGAAIIFREGVICLLIVSPIFYVVILAGALLGRIWFKVDRTRLLVSVLPLLAVLALGEPLTRVDKESVITDEILIHAPATKVWREVTSFPEIPSSARFWLFRLGLPYPMATTSAGDFVNAERQCIFSDKAVFKEKVVELVPREKLTFEIVESPQDPELVGHLTPHRGQFILRNNADGTTTLTGSTWYTLHVRPLWYFDLWTQHIFRAVHLRVMEDIRRRAELPL
jgi:hypothetical protein